SGGEEHFAFNSAVAQFVFGLASFLSPHIYSYLVTNIPHAASSGAFVRFMARITPPHLPWASVYWIFTAVAATMAIVVAAVRFPRIERTAEEQVGTLATYRQLLRRRVVWLYSGCVFAYVASEQGTADWISTFLARYHGFDPHTTGA